MSSYIQPKIKAFVAEADLSAKQFGFVKFGSTNEKVVACGADEKAIGVVMNQPKLGETAEIALLGGGALVKIAGAISLGDSIKSDANGKGVAGSTGIWSAAIAMDSGVANDVIAVILDGHYLP